MYALAIVTVQANHKHDFDKHYIQLPNKHTASSTRVPTDTWSVYSDQQSLSTVSYDNKRRVHLPEKKPNPCERTLNHYLHAVIVANGVDHVEHRQGYKGCLRDHAQTTSNHGHTYIDETATCPLTHTHYELKIKICKMPCIAHINQLLGYLAHTARVYEMSNFTQTKQLFRVLSAYGTSVAPCT